MDIIKIYEVKVHANGSFLTDIEGEKFSHQQFIDFSAHNVEINNCNFSFAVFTRVYFRKVKFKDCDFTGAKIFDSNLRDDEFFNCKFQYALFKFTLIRTKEILRNLPI